MGELKTLCRWHDKNSDESVCTIAAPQLFLLGMAQDMAGQPKPVFMAKFPPCVKPCKNWECMEQAAPVWGN